MSYHLCPNDTIFLLNDMQTELASFFDMTTVSTTIALLQGSYKAAFYAFTSHT